MPSEAEHRLPFAVSETLLAKPFGECALILRFEKLPPHPESLNLGLSLYRFLRKAGIPHLLDIIPAVHTITLIFDVLAMTLQGLRNPQEQMLTCLHQALQTFPDSRTPLTYRRLRIPVCYHPRLAPDIQLLAGLKNINPLQVAHLHYSATYRVIMLGFLPGFAYMGFVPKALEITRHAQLRNKVAAGSVGIAGNQTGIYPLPSPGGWFIIGRTPLSTFLPDADCPCLFQPGDEVEFYPISPEEFEAFPKKSYNPIVT